MMNISATLDSLKTVSKNQWQKLRGRVTFDKATYFRLIKRKARHAGASLACEFGISGKPHPARVVSEILKYTKILIAALVTYVLYRYLLLSALTPERLKTDETVLHQVVDQVYDQNFFELIFLIALTGLVTSSVIRFVRPIRFTATLHWIMLGCFGLYLLEKYHLHDFKFFTSKVFKLDYCLFLGLPLMLEVILRIYYALRKPKLVNASLFLENRPIRDDDEDKTTRKLTTNLIAKHINQAPFSQSYSIGIVGDWGVGKTSFFNSLEIKISKSTIIIHFNPWLSTGKNSLLQEYIDSLKDELGQYDKSLSAELDSYLNSLIELEKNAKTNITGMIDNMFRSTHSSSVELEKVKRSIERIGKKIVIIIDDLDRLDKTEIIEVLKLIRNTGDFPNTVYISCYDKVFLLHALQNFSKRNISIQLDKFFDIEIPLAPFPPMTLSQYISEQFFTPYSISEKESAVILESVGNTTFRQFRETKKFISSLRLNYNLYGKSLYLHDFFILEVLKVKYPFLPDLLWRDKHRYLAGEGSPAIMKLLTAETEADEKAVDCIETELISKEKDEFAKHFLGNEDHLLIMRLLKILFPGKPYGHVYAIQEPNFFESYFYNQIPDSKTGISNWYASILSNTYLDDPFFQEPYDAKKAETIFDALFTNPEQYKATFGTQDALIFHFLRHLVDWSMGKVPITPFIKAFQHSSEADKKLYFSILMVAGKLTKDQIEARTTFFGTIIRSLIYEPQITIEFTDLESIKIHNLSLCETYFRDLDEFTNQAFTIFHNQIDTISDARKVSLHPRSFNMLKAFVEKDPVGYLDLLIRAASLPNFSLWFALEPMTFPQLFETKEKFIDFIKSAKQYPEFRKKILLEYVTRSKKDEAYGRYQFVIDPDQLAQMPAEFRNAWVSVPKAIKDRLQSTDVFFQTRLTNQPPPNEKPDDNDHVLNQVFEIDEGELEVVITPSKLSKFWRLGFKFSADKDFIKLQLPRHSPQYPDVCITVGQPTKGNVRLLTDYNILDLVEVYKLDPQLNYFTRDLKYDGGPVSVRIKMTKVPENYITFELENGGRSFGVKGYPLKTLKYFRIAAWCDQQDFELQLDIRIKMRIDGKVVEAQKLALEQR